MGEFNVEALSATDVTKVGARWSAGNLIFHESTSLADTVNLLTLTTTGITVGNASNDVDFTVYATGSGSFVIDYSAATMTLTGISPVLAGAVTVDIGTSSVPIVLTAGAPIVDVYTTCATTDSVAQPVLFNTVMTGAGGLGGRVRVNLSTNVSLGSYANAFKASVDCNSIGGATGLLSVGCFEITMPTVGIAGTTVGVEIEMSYGATCGALQKPAFFYLGTNGTARTDFDTYGDFLILSNNLTAGTGKAVGAGTSTFRIGTGALGATKRYIPLSTAEASYTTAYPIVSSSTTGIRSTATFVPDQTYTNYALAIGTEVNELLVTFAQSTNQNLDLIQFNIDVDSAASGTGPTASSQMNAIHGYITHDTDEMAFLRLKGADLTIEVAKNVLDAYAYQGEVDFTGDSVFNEAAALGLCVNAGSGTVAGLLRGIIVQMQGALPAATMAIEIRNIGGGSTLSDGIFMDGATTITNAITLDSTVTNAIRFHDADGSNAANSADSITTATSSTGSFRINVGGTAYYVPFYAAGVGNAGW